VRRGWIAGGAALAAVLAAVAWQSVAWLHDGRAEAEVAPAPTPSASPSGPQQSDSSTGVVTIDTPQSTDTEVGATPMAERVAVLGVLNKRNGDTRDITMKPGQAVRVGDAVIRLRACDTTAPWEPQDLTGAFVQVDVKSSDQHWRRVFSGWLYKERPELNVVQNAIYDVWPKSCKMSRPDSGPDSVSATSVLGSGASSAKKSPAPADENDGADAAEADAPVVTTDATPAPAAAPAPSASPSNAR
jgi:hypothetical protein